MSFGLTSVVSVIFPLIGEEANCLMKSNAVSDFAISSQFCWLMYLQLPRLMLWVSPASLIDRGNFPSSLIVSVDPKGGFVKEKVQVVPPTCLEMPS